MLKAYERDIPAQRVEIVKLKAGIGIIKSKRNAKAARNKTRVSPWKWKFMLKKRNFRNGTKIKRSK
ncbi:hypothetical protein D6D54_05190 [Spiroplasma poulsonii]|uniref:Uncharacterized protein n=1 Tax=Spiroplasma poulsonii TaxID=2138 RepID=A0A3S0SLE3_9MOLU|nr:hypothetical protein D6D54_05190 [Spiroplasma poulsonii]